MFELCFGSQRIISIALCKSSHFSYLVSSWTSPPTGASDERDVAYAAVRREHALDRKSVV